MKNKAVILLSGGLDSAVTLYLALKEGLECHCLSFRYGQRHAREVECARSLTLGSGAKHYTVEFDLPWKGSSLFEGDRPIPIGRTMREISSGIPSTYVPARNTIFLSMAASCAEAIGACDIFIGAHWQDSSGYPDCRKEYLEAFNNVIKQGTRDGSSGGLRVKFPLISKTKREIIRLGAALGVPFERTWSCYSGTRQPCGECDSCVLRARGFKEAGIEDSLLSRRETPGSSTALKGGAGCRSNINMDGSHV